MTRIAALLATLALLAPAAVAARPASSPPAALRAVLVAGGYRYLGSYRQSGRVAYVARTPDKQRARMAVRYGSDVDLAVLMLRRDPAARAAFERTVDAKRTLRVTAVRAWHDYLVLTLRKT